MNKKDGLEANYEDLKSQYKIREAYVDYLKLCYHYLSFKKHQDDLLEGFKESLKESKDHSEDLINKVEDPNNESKDLEAKYKDLESQYEIQEAYVRYLKLYNDYLFFKRWTYELKEGSKESEDDWGEVEFKPVSSNIDDDEFLPPEWMYE